MRAAELIASADVILYDRLIPPDALAARAPDAELVYVGKEGGGEQVPQEETNELLARARAGGRARRAAQGRRPVRVRPRRRGGARAARGRHPVRGRAGHHRGHRGARLRRASRSRTASSSSAVAFVTGHENPAKPETALDWAALAAFPGTLVFYMGVRALPRIAERADRGRPLAGRAGGGGGARHAARQRTCARDAGHVAERATAAGVRAPAVTLVGPVAALGEQLDVARRRARCTAARVAVTRARAQASALAARLRALGADVVEAPAIRTRTLEDVELPTLAGDDLIVLTSPNGVPSCSRCSSARPRRARARRPPGRRDRARAPRARCASTGSWPTSCRERAVAEGLVEALDGHPRGQRAGRPRARGPRRPAGRAAGARRRRWTSSRSTRPSPSRSTTDALAAASGADWITFTSASTVRFLAEAAGGALATGPRLASIGPATSAALREHGREPDLEADPHTPDGLIDALVNAA